MFSKINHVTISSLLVINTLLISGVYCQASAISATQKSLHNTKSNNMNNFDTKELIKKLLSDDYGNLNFFNYGIRDSIITEIWHEPNSLERLENVIKDRNAPMKARFLACEILFDKELIFLVHVGNKTVAEIYVQAFLNNYTGMANSWGFLYELNHESRVGVKFLMIGEEAVLLLEKLLDNDNPISSAGNMRYIGSQEATIGNHYKYRIKDFAAFYISSIMVLPIKYYEEPKERDTEIERLKVNIRDVRELKSLMKKALVDSRSYYTIESLPERERIRSLAQTINKNIKRPFWGILNQIEYFFLFAIAPESEEIVPWDISVQDYCFALKKLTGEWWGFPALPPTKILKMFDQEPHIAYCLVKLLDDTTPVKYSPSKTAINIQAETWKWQVSDIAAWLILSKSDQEYDPYLSPSARQIIKQQLKSKLGR